MRDNKLIQIYTTTLCNSKCKTCHIWHNKVGEARYLSSHVIENIITSFPYADYVIGGGEFILHPYKDEIMNILCKNGVNYTILSNCINYNRLLRLIDDYSVKNLTISCDGVEHDSIRGVKGNLQNIKDAITRLYYTDKVPGFKISYTLSKFNEKNIDKDMQFFKDMRINKIYFCIAHDMGLLNTSGIINPTKDSLKYIIEKYSDMLYDKDKDYIARYLVNQRRECESPSNVHTIYANGDVVYCQSYKSDVIIGNVYKKSLYNILLENKDLIDDSKKCPYSDKCTLLCQRRYD